MPEEIEFYDVKTKKKFKTTEYRIEEKNGRYFAVAQSPDGPHECWRVIKNPNKSD